MAWAKFDDGFADHPKVRRLSDAAFRLHVAGILYCARWLTDGVVTAEALPDLVRRYKPSATTELVACGMWREAAGGDAYVIHDYLEWNDSREKVERRRTRNADRIREWRIRNGKEVD